MSSMHEISSTIDELRRIVEDAGEALSALEVGVAELPSYPYEIYVKGEIDPIALFRDPEIAAEFAVGRKCTIVGPAGGYKVEAEDTMESIVGGLE